MRSVLKRFSTGAAVLAVTAGLAACGGSDDDTTTAAASGGSAGGSVPKLTIGVIPSTLQSETLQHYVDYLKKTCEPVGCEVDVRDPAGDPAKMGQAMQALVTKKVDAIALMALDAGPFAQQLQAAKTADIPVVSLGFRGDPKSTEQFDFTLADNADQNGAALGEWIAANKKDDPIAAGRVKTNFAGDILVTSAGKELESKGLKYADTRDSDLADLVNSVVKNTTAQVQKIKGPFTLVHHCDCAPPIIQPILDRLNRKDVTIATQYLPPATKKLIQAGSSIAVVDTDGYQHVFDLVDRLLAWKAGGELNTKDDIRTNRLKIVTKDNLPTGDDTFPFAADLEKQAAEWKSTYGGATR